MFRNKQKTQRGIVHGWRWLGDVWEGHGEGTKSERQASSMYQTSMWIAVTWGPHGTLSGFYTPPKEALSYWVSSWNWETASYQGSQDCGLYLRNSALEEKEVSCIVIGWFLIKAAENPKTDGCFVAIAHIHSPALHVNPLEMTSLLRL